jgi:hypothetical protein
VGMHKRYSIRRVLRLGAAVLLLCAGLFATTPAAEASTTPTCTVVLPVNGAVVSGRTVFSAAASPGTTAVSYYLNGELLGPALPTGYGWLFTPDNGVTWGWDSLLRPDGTYALTCRATHPQGIGFSQPITITVDNVAPAADVAPRTFCLNDNPSGPPSYQQAFDTRTAGWAGADGAHSTLLPDGRILWAFGDTYVGTVDAQNRFGPGRLYLGNSYFVQEGRCFSPLFGGEPTQPGTFLRHPTPGMVYWPARAFVDTAVTPAVVRVPLLEVSFPPGEWFKVVGIDIATLSLPGLRHIGTLRNMPYGETTRNVPGFGALGGLVDSDYVYFYGKADMFEEGGPNEGFRPGEPFSPGIHLARVPRSNVLTGTWRYWTGSKWSTRVTDAAPLKFAPTGSPQPEGPGFSVVRYGAGYLLAGRVGGLEGVFSPRIDAWYAPRPRGPWNHIGQIVPASPPLPGSLWYYGSDLVTDLPGTSTASPMVVFSTNPTGCEGIPCTPLNDFRLNVLLYGPRFVTPSNLPTPQQLRALYGP